MQEESWPQVRADPAPVADAPSAADGMMHSLDPRWIRYRRRVAWLSSTLLASMVLVAAIVVVLVADWPAVPVVAVAMILLIARMWLAQWWPAVEYRYASYRLDGRTLEIRRGVLTRSVIVVPRSRIQHSDVSQGPFERHHGLGTLSVYTAGTSHALVQLHGLEHARALSIREHLMLTDEDDVI